MIPSLLLLPENSNRHGEPSGTNDQVLFKVCTRCNQANIIKRYEHYLLHSISEYSSQISDYDEDGNVSNADFNKLINDYSLGIYKYFRREYVDDLMCIASRRFVDFMHITGIRGDGEYKVFLDYINNAVLDDLSDELDLDIDE